MKRSKHGLFVFPPKKILIWRRHCSIGQSCCSLTLKRSIDWFLEFFGHEVFSHERLLNQPKATRDYIRSINQSNRSISVRSLFLFCSRVFISRSYENRSIHPWRLFFVDVHLTNVAIQKTAPDYDAEKVTILLFAFHVTLFNSKTFYCSHSYETQF